MNDLALILWCLAAGYLAKKYELPARIGLKILDGTAELSRVAGREFSRGMVDIGPEIDAPKFPGV